VGSIKPTEVEAWFEILASTPQGRKRKPLKWPTIEKINSVMSQIYGHAQRNGLIPAEMIFNPFRHPKFGGARCKTQSDYEGKVVTPEQMIAILATSTDQRQSSSGSWPLFTRQLRSGKTERKRLENAVRVGLRVENRRDLPFLSRK
jgi:hypothetical protein